MRPVCLTKLARLSDRALHALDAKNPKNWRCPCGQQPEFFDENWQWNGKEWEHAHADGIQISVRSSNHAHQMPTGNCRPGTGFDNQRPGVTPGAQTVQLQPSVPIEDHQSRRTNANTARMREASGCGNNPTPEYGRL